MAFCDMIPLYMGKHTYITCLLCELWGFSSEGLLLKKRKSDIYFFNVNTPTQMCAGGVCMLVSVLFFETIFLDL